MKLIDQSYKILTDLSVGSVLLMKLQIENAARICYKTEDKLGQFTDNFLNRLWHQEHHESIFEHVVISVQLITNRGVTHELVRHRIGVAYSMESTRYCDYSKDKFDRQITFIRPVWWKDWSSEQQHIFEDSCRVAENDYMSLLNHGAKAQEAREVLPNSLKTEIMVTANLREWKHIFDLRCSEKAHPQIRALLEPVEKEFRTKFGTPF